MIGTTFTYYDNAGPHRRQIKKEVRENGLRVYIMQDLDNPGARVRKAIADTIDRNFLVVKQAIRPKNCREIGTTKVRRRGKMR